MTVKANSSVGSKLFVGPTKIAETISHDGITIATAGLILGNLVWEQFLYETKKGRDTQGDQEKSGKPHTMQIIVYSTWGRAMYCLE